jgi:alpha-glucosidase
VDVIWLMMKDEQFRDEPADPNWDGVNPHSSLRHIYTQSAPGIHELIQQMRGVLDEYDERMMVGEIYLPFDELVAYYGRSHNECHMPFNFHLIANPDWRATAVRQLVEDYEAALPDGAWPNWVLGNHDQHRVATRVGPAQARIANMLLLTLRGTPTTYYGEEIGMEDGHIPPEFIQDPPAVNQPEIAHIVGRDPERTPMQWDASPHAGFTAAESQPWLPVAANYRALNVAAQEDDPASMLNLYRALARLRRAEPALAVGAYVGVETAVSDIFAYRRTSLDGDDFLVVLNFGSQARVVDMSVGGKRPLSPSPATCSAAAPSTSPPSPSAQTKGWSCGCRKSNAKVQRRKGAKKPRFLCAFHPSRLQLR